MFSLAINGEKVLHTIAAKDITRTAADLLLDDSWDGGESINLVGPDNLTPDEMAQIISKTSGKPVVFQQTRFEDYQTNLMRFGMSEVWAKGGVDMVRAINEGFYEEDAAASKRSPTSLKPGVSRCLNWR